MADAGNMEMPKSSSSTPSANSREFWPKRFKIDLLFFEISVFCYKKKEIAGGSKMIFQDV